MRGRDFINGSIAAALTPSERIINTNSLVLSRPYEKKVVGGHMKQCFGENRTKENTTELTRFTTNNLNLSHPHSKRLE